MVQLVRCNLVRERLALQEVTCGRLHNYDSAFLDFLTAGLRESAYGHTSFGKLAHYLIKTVTTLRRMSHGVDISRVVIHHAFPIPGIY